MAGAVPAGITGSPAGFMGGGKGGSSGPQQTQQQPFNLGYSGHQGSAMGNPRVNLDGNFGIPPQLGPPSAAHQFPSFDKWGGKDGAKNFVMPDNAYKARTNEPLDYNQMAQHMANNQSWTPGAYFGPQVGESPLNSRFANFANMSGNSYGAGWRDSDPFGARQEPQVNLRGGGMAGAAPAGGQRAPSMGKGAPAQGGKGGGQMGLGAYAAQNPEFGPALAKSLSRQI